MLEYQPSLVLLRGFLSSHVAAESACRGELAQPVTNHVFGDVDRNVAAPVMDGDRVSNHLREDHTCATPGANHFLLALLVHRFNSIQKFGLNERALFQ